MDSGWSARAITTGDMGKTSGSRRHETYAHNDPNGAFPQNDFLDQLVPFLAQVRRARR
jgi:hypothetical protein